MMKGHQLLRALGVVGLISAYIARLSILGNGEIMVLGYQMDPIGLVAIGILLLAAPETIEQLPFGPSRKA